MWHRRDPGGLWLLCLESGERVRPTLESFCAELGLEGANLGGIGGLTEVELGFWKGGDYARQILSGNWELLSLQGNISRYEDKPFAHLHASLAGPDLAVRGGHFFDGTVTATAELFLWPCGPIQRRWSPAIGAGLWVSAP